MSDDTWVGLLFRINSCQQHVKKRFCRFRMVSFFNDSVPGTLFYNARAVGRRGDVWDAPRRLFSLGDLTRQWLTTRSSIFQRGSTVRSQLPNITSSITNRACDLLWKFHFTTFIFDSVIMTHFLSILEEILWIFIQIFTKLIELAGLHRWTLHLVPEEFVVQLLRMLLAHCTLCVWRKSEWSGKAKVFYKKNPCSPLWAS